MRVVETERLRDLGRPVFISVFPRDTTNTGLYSHQLPFSEWSFRPINLGPWTNTSKRKIGFLVQSNFSLKIA